MAGSIKGAVAGGHTLTVMAAVDVLREGGNAFDAAIAGLWMACVCEPVLASPGGGGFFMARQTGAPAPVLFDFFVQTPLEKRKPEAIDFHAIHADFGTATQEFHIGPGASAVPGYIPGLYAVSHEIGTMSMDRLLAPAITAARTGIEVTPFQAFLSNVVSPILTATETSRALHAPEGRLLPKGALFRNRELARFFELLAEGGLEFYSGDAAPAFVRGEAEQGHLQEQDFRQYRVLQRAPVKIAFAGTDVHLNPPPSPGGAFVAHALTHLDPASSDDMLAIADALRAAEAARCETGGDATAMLSAIGLSAPGGPVGGTASRGTTHISVIDAAGNAASATVSNGAGNGHIAGGYGFMLNNMLGEEDLNPGGFHRWREGKRLASNMCPVVAEGGNGGLAALGSGGSNRIRSAIFQVLAHVLGAGHGIGEAVAMPRLHVEGEEIDFENLFTDDTGESLKVSFPRHRAWEEPNLFFGGVHAVSFRDGTFEAVGDRRRGGHWAIVQ